MLGVNSAMTIPTVGILTPPSSVEYLALVPGGLVCVLALFVIIIEVFHEGRLSRDYQAYVSAMGLAAIGGICLFFWNSGLDAPAFQGTIYFDKFTIFVSVLSFGLGALAMAMSPAYLQRHDMNRAEYYILILFSISGICIVAAAADFMTFFIGFEVMSIPVYVVAGFLRREADSAEASVKYFILGAFSAALMLYGIALIYGVTGTTNFEMIGQHLGEVVSDGQGGTKLVVLGGLLVLFGLVFKVSAVPFHFWTPDVYTGSPVPAVGFMASAVKAGGFAALIRIMFIAFGAVELRGGFFGYGWVDALLALSALSMILGNLVAITQSNVKRMLAYSSIAHAGYILVGITAAAAEPEFFAENSAVLFYFVTYGLGTLGAFGVLAAFSRRGRDVDEYRDLNGLGLRFPALGLSMGVFMFSSAGIPPTGGFVGKLYVFRSAVKVGANTGEAAFIGLTVLAVLTSVASVYYYLKVLVHMYMKESRDAEIVATMKRPGRFAVAICAAGIMYLGVMPSTLVQWSESSVENFQGIAVQADSTGPLGQKAADSNGSSDE